MIYRALLLCLCFFLCWGSPVGAQNEQEEPTAALPSAITPMQPAQTAVLRALDKVTARTTTFRVDVGTTVQFERIYIRVQACMMAAPLEDPESAAFVQTWETPTEGKPSWIFSGWMYASSPALSAMDHPVYDVWVIDCLSAPQPEPENKDGASDGT